MFDELPAATALESQIADWRLQIAKDRVRQSKRWCLELHSCSTQIMNLDEKPFNLKSKSEIYNQKPSFQTHSGARRQPFTEVYQRNLPPL